MENLIFVKSTVCFAHEVLLSGMSDLRATFRNAKSTERTKVKNDFRFFRVGSNMATLQMRFKKPGLTDAVTVYELKAQNNIGYRQ